MVKSLIEARFAALLVRAIRGRCYVLVGHRAVAAFMALGHFVGDPPFSK